MTQGDGDYGIIPKNSVEAATIMHKQGYHGIVMEYYNRFMERYEPDIWFNVSGAKSQKLPRRWNTRKKRMIRVLPTPVSPRTT